MHANDLYLRRSLKLKIKSYGTENVCQPVITNAQIATFQKNLSAYGYLCSIEVINKLKWLGEIQFNHFYEKLIKSIKDIVGAKRTFKPMYPNFPTQVMEMSEAELYINAIMHYITLNVPEYAKDKRPALIENVDYKIIELGSNEDFMAIFTKLAGSNASLSEQDREDMKWFIKSYSNIDTYLPESMPFKENAMFVCGEMINAGFDIGAIKKIVKTPTDVLRLAASLSGGDVTLVKTTKFKSMSRKIRKIMLECMDTKTSTEIVDEMARYANRWKRLGERLHPGEFKGRYLSVYTAFEMLRKNTAPISFMGDVNQKIAAGEIREAALQLFKKPGLLARRLDHLLRVSLVPAYVMVAFDESVDKMATPLIMQVMAHFRSRNTLTERAFLIKKKSKLKIIPNTLPTIRQDLVDQVIKICQNALKKRFSALPSLGKVYIDPDLANFVMPFGQRTASKSSRTLIRGSRLAMPINAKTLRFFVWWKNIGKSKDYGDRVDIDLSAVAYDDKFGHIFDLAYYNLREQGAHHSGDITDAPKGASEFIDIDIDKQVERGARYILMCINSFTGQKFSDMPECYAGWMSREKPKSGEIYEPSTVQDKVDITSEATMSCPLVIDLVTKQVIWLDLGLTGGGLNNLRSNSSAANSLVRMAVTALQTKNNLHQLFSMHANARGTVVDKVELADVAFVVNGSDQVKSVTPFDIPLIASEYMA